MVLGMEKREGGEVWEEGAGVIDESTAYRTTLPGPNLIAHLTLTSISLKTPLFPRRVRLRPPKIIAPFLHRCVFLLSCLFLASEIYPVPSSSPSR